MKQISILFILVFFIYSCTFDFLNDLNNNTHKPEISEPHVASFIVENEIIIDWDKDIGADEYILYKDDIHDGSFKSIIFEGKDLSYNDNEVSDGTNYYYKLAKKKGDVIFDKSDPVLGIGSAIARDIYEPNENPDEAQEFSNYISANIYYYDDNEGNIIADYDWYWVTIGPRQKLTIRIDFESNLVAHDLVYRLQEKAPVGITSGNQFVLYNYNYSATRFNFLIAVNLEVFLPSPPGGKLGFYYISFILIDDVDPPAR